MALRNNLLSSLELFDTYVNNRVGDKASDEALAKMKTIFEGVAETDRGFVFNVFLQFLRDDGVQFDTEQFQAA